MQNHIFQNHLLSPLNQEAVLRPETPDVWALSIFVLAFIVLVIIRINNGKRMLAVFNSFFSFTNTRQLIREDYRLRKPLSLSLLLVYLTMLAYLLYKINSYLTIIPSTGKGYLDYLIILAGLLIFDGLKALANILLGKLIEEESSIRDYIFSSAILFKGTGVFLFPVLLVFYLADFQPYVLIAIGGSIVFLFFSIKLIRGVLIGYGQYGFSVFHLFLYLCTLEILPLVVLIKILISQKALFG